MTDDFTYIYIGPSADDITVPVPDPSDAPFKVETNALWEANANGEEVGQQIGEPFITQSFSWGYISAGDWWALGKYFLQYGDAFFCKFFNHSIGEWEVKEYRKTGDMGFERPMYDPADARPTIPDGEEEGAMPGAYMNAYFTARSVGN